MPKTAGELTDKPVEIRTVRDPYGQARRGSTGCLGPVLVALSVLSAFFALAEWSPAPLLIPVLWAGIWGPFVYVFTYVFVKRPGIFASNEAVILRGPFESTTIPWRHAKFFVAPEMHWLRRTPTDFETVYVQDRRTGRIYRFEMGAFIRRATGQPSKRDRSGRDDPDMQSPPLETLVAQLTQIAEDLGRDDAQS